MSLVSLTRVNQVGNLGFERLQSIYSTTRNTVDASIAKMFDLSESVTTDLFPTIIIVATIYIALMGYALISGWITMSPRDAGVKFSKVLLILILTNLFMNFAPNLYDAVWAVPETIGNYLVARLNPLLNIGAFFGIFVDFDILMDGYATEVSKLSERITQEQTVGKTSGLSLGLGAWGIMMAPLFVITIAILIAKLISAVLFMLAPVIFILSLLGFQNNYLMSWFKAILLTFVTVMIVYMIASLTLTMMIGPLTIEANIPPSSTNKYSLPDFAQLGILSIFTVVLVSQATTIASSLIGAAAVNTQQATGFLQIGALQAASRVG